MLAGVGRSSPKGRRSLNLRRSKQATFPQASITSIDVNLSQKGFHGFNPIPIPVLLVFIDSDVFNDPCATANAAVPAGFAGFPAAKRFINNADLNNNAKTFYRFNLDRNIVSRNSLKQQPDHKPPS
jgi:hypothetical protein